MKHNKLIMVNFHFRDNHENRLMSDLKNLSNSLTYSSILFS